MLCAVAWMTVGFASCSECLEEDQAGPIRTSEMETDQENGRVPEDESEQVEEPTAEAAVGKEQGSVPDEQAQEESHSEI